MLILIYLIKIETKLFDFLGLIEVYKRTSPGYKSWFEENLRGFEPGLPGHQ